jgi:hypothetical protein
MCRDIPTTTPRVCRYILFSTTAPRKKGTAMTTNATETIRADYMVTVGSKDENDDTLLLEEHYATEAEALARLEEIATEGGWGDNLEAWVFVRSGDFADSIDGRDLDE